MPDQASPDDHERYEQRVHDAQSLRDTVDEHLRVGDLDKAKRAFSRSWKGAVPDLPLRFHPILHRPDAKAVLELRARLRPGVKVPDLRLRYIGGRKSPHTVEVWTVGRPSSRLGDLPARDVKFLTDIGLNADLYRPQLLEIRVTPELRLDYIAVELAREETRQCPHCDNSHNGMHILCEDCRQIAVDPDDQDEPIDAAPIAFHEAIEAIAVEHAGDDSDPLS